MQLKHSSQATCNLDVFFQQAINADSLVKLTEWTGYPVSLSKVEQLAYRNGETAYFVSISAQPEAEAKIIQGLWQHLRIPLVAYAGFTHNYQSCNRWMADDHGVSCATITV